MSDTLPFYADLLKGIFGLYFGLHLFLIYKGYLRYGREKERMRQQLVRQYRIFFLLLPPLCLLFGGYYLVCAFRYLLAGT